MKQLILLFVAFFSLHQITDAQLTALQNGGNKKAVTGERIGLTDVTIHYDRPGVKGREGKIWGTLVPYGFNDLGFGTSKASPWRAGANENTTIEFSTDVKINGNDLPAGKYGFSIALGKEESILIFSKNNSSWGSFFYDPKDDALRITVKQQPLDKEVEWLKYEFINQTPNSATIALEWENLMFPFKVEVDNNKVQMDFFRNELHSSKGFDNKAWVQAANWCADNNTNLDEGLQWADYAVSGRFIGEKSFATLSAKAKILSAMGKNADADSIMKQAMTMGTVNEVHAYARQLLTDKKNKEACEAFRANYKRFPNVFTTNVGMVRCLSSEGNYKEALKYANIALPQAPDMLNKTSVETMIEKLKTGKDVN
jgi:tetratricopeptide (TPR) repeat protein